MRKHPNKKMIGFFTVAGIVLFVAVMVLFIGDKLFVRKSDLSVLYFDETLKGLKVGSPVVFRGVEVGHVTEIEIITDLDDMTSKLPVYIDINEGVFRKYGHHEIKNKREFIKKLIDKGLKGRLTSQNFLTGQLMIELEVMPDVEAKYRGGVEKNLEIPTVMSPFSRLSKGLVDLPIKEVLENTNILLEKANARFPALLDETSRVVRNLNKIIETSSGDRANVIDNLNRTVKDVGEAAQALRAFADYIERHPEALIRGKGKY